MRFCHPSSTSLDTRDFGDAAVRCTSIGAHERRDFDQYVSGTERRPQHHHKGTFRGSFYYNLDAELRQFCPNGARDHDDDGVQESSDKVRH
jgi:hypothetical protein